VQQQVINITLKRKQERKQLRTAYMNIGTQTTADRTNYQDYNQGLSVNGNLDKFNYASLNSTETTGISEAVTAPAAYESDRFPE
jgi:vitamin B12 transporter